MQTATDITIDWKRGKEGQTLVCNGFPNMMGKSMKLFIEYILNSIPMHTLYTNIHEMIELLIFFSDAQNSYLVIELLGCPLQATWSFITVVNRRHFIIDGTIDLVKNGDCSNITNYVVNKVTHANRETIDDITDCCLDIRMFEARL